VRPSALPFEIEGQHLVLIDDADERPHHPRRLNELFDYGRPASVTLVCLLDLDAGELPIRPNVVGATLSLAAHERVKLSGPHRSPSNARPRPPLRPLRVPRDDASRRQAPAAAQ
jgi:pyrimidine operon attenuation protein/uracil phosphoribosyltransferase